MDKQQIERLRIVSGAGLRACAEALTRAGGDFALALGILKYNGCAINVKPQPGETKREAYDRWAMERARQYADDHHAEIGS